MSVSPVRQRLLVTHMVTLGQRWRNNVIKPGRILATMVSLTLGRSIDTEGDSSDTNKVVTLTPCSDTNLLSVSMALLS